MYYAVITTVRETKKRNNVVLWQRKADTLWATGLACQHTFLQEFPVHHCLGDYSGHVQRESVKNY